MNNASKLHFFTVSLLLLGCVGCQQRAASKLQGRWEGRPDSAITRAARDAEKYGDEPVTGNAANISPKDQATEARAGESDSTERVTDWEKYDVKLVMDFVSSDRLEISLEGEQPISGTWSVLSTTPSGCTIEVQSQVPETQAGKATVERRRFELLLDERDGVCVGFQLTEAGADAQLGSLYFQRPASSNDTRQN